ncbi:MAG: alpha/beta fold hydrolase, partial [Pseudomonadales bacterium]|nr:alpha/beta fold hydrolase [Pseudomonadales bacterium]
VDRVVATLDECDAPAVLVGHSMGGGVIAQTGERAPDKIERLVFVAAFVPRDGESMLDLTGSNQATVLRDNLEVSSDRSVLTVPESLIQPAFYHDCDEEDIALARERLRPQNAAVFAERFSLTDENFGSLEKQFIECIEDQVINILSQRQMARRAGCLINTLQTSHSPFFSAPAALAACIAQIGIRDDSA